mgnify:FL=1|jgi:hypothetical protein
MAPPTWKDIHCLYHHCISATIKDLGYHNLDMYFTQGEVKCRRTQVEIVNCSLNTIFF